MSDNNEMIRVGETDFYIWPDVHSWNVGKKVSKKPGKKDKRDYRMDHITYHGSLGQAVAEVFERQLKVSVVEAKTLADMRQSYLATLEWIKGLFPDLKQ